jgi:phenylalanyl-tRNA synthetase beta chain
MQFLLSWLADHVDLASTVGLPLAPDTAGRQHLERLTDEDKAKAFQLGKTLTGVGLAVEGLAEQTSASGAPDFVFDIDVTSNRPDCMNHLGVARELAVALGTTLRRESFPSTESISSLYSVSKQKASSSSSSTAKVVIEDAEACPRFTARTIRGVKLGPSPEWLRRRLEAIGARSINNVVDATNYVLRETGQPLHAYDLATIPGGELRVRRARAGETLVTLDGKSRALDVEVLVIADRERPVGLAGIMGGLDTEVTGRTVDVLLEAAHFDRRRVRIGAKRLGLHTDASHRFERGADVGACDFASRRCADLIVEIAGGTIDPGAIDALGTLPEPVRWRLEPAALARFAGLDVPEAEIARILLGLGFAPERTTDGAFAGTVPTWRAVDFEPRRRPRAAGPEREAWAQDLFEEVLRQHGLDRLPSTLPRLPGVDAGLSPGFELRMRIARRLAGLGFAEGIHYAFQDRAADERLPALVDGPPIELANPLSDRYAVLRRSLVPNLVAAAEFNFRHGAEAVRLFELGGLFPGAGEEVAAVAAVAAGGAGAPWDRRPAIDLHELAGVLEALLEELGVDAAAEPAELPGVVPGTGARWRAGGEIVGWSGTIAAADAPQPIHAGELRLDRLAAPPGARPVIAPPRLPGISADLTLVHPLERSWREIERAVAEARVEHLVAFRLKDRYQGAGVPAGAVATTMTFDYHAGERTLTQEEVNERHGALAAGLERRFGLAREGPR